VHARFQRKYLTTVVLFDRDFLLRASNFGNLAAFRAILDTFSLRMRKTAKAYIYEPPMKILTAAFDFLIMISSGERYVGDLNTFLLSFCIGYAEFPPYFYFRSN